MHIKQQMSFSCIAFWSIRVEAFTKFNNEHSIGSTCSNLVGYRLTAIESPGTGANGASGVASEYPDNGCLGQDFLFRVPVYLIGNLLFVGILGPDDCRYLQSYFTKKQILLES